MEQTTRLGGLADVTIQVDDSEGPYNFAWTPSVSNDAMAFGLTEGSYQVEITNGWGCVVTEPMDILEQPTTNYDL